MDGCAAESQILAAKIPAEVKRTSLRELYSVYCGLRTLRAASLLLQRAGASLQPAECRH
jgi:hypothetical protein